MRAKSDPLTFASDLLGAADRFVVFVFPAGLLGAFVLAYARSYPVWETWFFIPVWDDFHNHGPWFADLFINRWGHISAVPNFINLMVDSLFNYDQRIDMYLIVVTGIASLYLLLRYYVPSVACFTRIYLGLTFLSLRAAEIWLDGWNTAMTVPLLISLGAGACVLHANSWKWLVAGALLTFLGINAGGYCLPIIPAVLIVLVSQALLGLRGSNSRAAGQIAAWLLWSVLLAWYWIHMRGSNTGGLLHTMLLPDSYASLARELAFALGDGYLGICLFAVISGVLLLCLPVARRLRCSGVLPGLIFMAVYSSVLALLIVAERSHHGDVALHVRYIPFLCLLPVSILALAECLVASSTGLTALMPASPRWRVGFLVLLCIFIASAVYNDLAYYRSFVPVAPQLAALDRAYRDAPDTLTPGMFLYRSASDPMLIEHGIATMKRLRLGPFKHSGLPDTPRLPSVLPANGLKKTSIQVGIDRTEVNADGNAVIIGWAFDPARDARPQTGSARTVSGCTETALIGLPRPDVAAFFKSSHAAASGWMITLPAHCIDAGKLAAVAIRFTSAIGQSSVVERML